MMMTLLTDDRVTGTRDFTGEFMLPPATLASEDLAQKPLSRLSREQLAAFLEAESGNARSAHFNVPPTEPAPPTPEKGLAVGVLKRQPMICAVSVQPREAPIGSYILMLIVGSRHMISPGRTLS